MIFWSMVSEIIIDLEVSNIDFFATTANNVVQLLQTSNLICTNKIWPKHRFMFADKTAQALIGS